MPPAPDFPIETLYLDNGLRVVVQPDHSAPLVTVAVYYDVGFRSEPEGRTGFAHLFEHMMFQGSANAPKNEHSRIINGSGGSLNGSTAPDWTNYYEILPASALDVALFLEADRMDRLAVTADNLANQISVVEEEIRVNVLNRPYGGFPWITLSALMFDTFANSHNGYGSFVDLRSATVDDAIDFYRTYYCPGNAVVVVVGDVDPAEVAALAEHRFGQIPHRPAPERSDFSEPLPSVERRGNHPDPAAPTPAAALGYRVPDPDDLDATLTLEVALSMLVDGDASPLQRRLIRDSHLATAIGGWVGVFGGRAGPADRHPTRLQIIAYYPAAPLLDDIIAVVDEEVAVLTAGADPARVERAVTRLTSGYLRGLDGFVSRALTLGPLALLRGDPAIVNVIPERLARVTPEMVADAAATWLRPEHRSVLVVTPDASS